jgi:hypothetical protein
MTHSTRAARRLTALAATAALAAYGVAGAGPAAGTPPPAEGITRLTITPTSAATSVGSNACQTYTITETGATAPSVSIRVNLQPSRRLDSQFCTPTSSTNPTAGAGNLDRDDLVINTAQSSSVSFGVNAATPAVGTVAITAYPSNGTDTPGPVSATASQTFVAGGSQNSIVTGLSVTPATQYQTESTPGIAWTVTALHASSVVSGVGGITGTITSKQGNPTGTSIQCTPTTDATGSVTCTGSAPPTTATQTGPYAVRFSTFTGPTTSVATTATLTTEAAPPKGTTLAVTCGDRRTLRSSPNACYVKTTDASLAISVVATVPAATTGGAATPGSNLAVSFSVSPFGAAVDPTTCATDASGACTVQLELPTPGATDTVYSVAAKLSTGAGQNATATVTDTPQIPATNISVSPASPNGAVGRSVAVAAAVTNQYGNPASSGVSVSFTVAGGELADGSTSGLATTGSDGVARVAVESSQVGSVTVTANLQPGSATPNCTSPADSSTGAAAGNCSASTTVSFQAPVVERPTLAVTPLGHGKFRLRATTHPKITGARIGFYRLSNGRHVSIAAARAGNGIATATVRLARGHRYTLAAQVLGLAPPYVSEYSASRSVRT